MADNGTPQLTIEIQLDDGTVKKGIAKLPEHFKPVGKKSGEEMGDGVETGLKSKLGGIKTMMLGFAGTLAAGLTVGKAISEAAEEEDAVNQLGAALRQTNRYTDDLANSLNDFAGEMQKTTRFSDDAVLSGMALLQTLTNLDEKGLKRATKAAADLASGLHIDLQTAMMLVGKAAEGEIGTFGRYGMKIQEGATNAETFANTLKAIETKMGGRAEADLNTFSGGIDHLKNSFNNLLGEMGKYIIKAPLVAAASKEITDSIASLTKSTSAKSQDSAFMFETSRSALNLAEALVYVSYGFEGIYNAAKIAFQFINYAASIAWGGIIQVANGLAKILPKDSELRQSIENMADAAEETAQERLKALGEAAGNAFDFSFSNAAMKSIGNIRDNLAAEEARLLALQNAPQTQGGGDANAESVSPALSTQDIIKLAYMEEAKKKSADMKKSMIKDNNDIAQSIKTTLAGGISGGVQNIVTSIMTGQNAFSNFAKFVLAAMGDMSIKLGEMFILKGLAIDAMKGLVGGAAIAAGISLVALGTVMKTWSGPLSGGSTTANGGVTPTYAENSVYGTSSETTKEEKQEPKTTVQVNIHGSVYDSQETGLRIVELMNEAINKNGARVYA